MKNIRDYKEEMMLLSLFLLFQQSVAKISRSRRASEYRLENGKFKGQLHNFIRISASLLPKNFGSLSTGRDNVLAMVAVQLKSEGRSKAQVRDLINQIFTHGCHCGWNYRRRKIFDFFRLTLVHRFVNCVPGSMYWG